MQFVQKSTLLAASLGLSLVLVGCNSGSSTPPDATSGKGGATTAETKPSGGSAVSIDGSSTVYPIAAGIVEGMDNKTDFSVSQAGTGAGMQKFINGEIDIADASRAIKPDEDAKLKEKGIEYFEVAIAYDGLAIVVNAKSKLDTIKTADLHKIWDKDSKVKKWNEIDPSWPDKEIKLYGPTTVHGTYEYFNEAINGNSKNSRADYSQQTDYSVMAAKIAGDEDALGYLGYGYSKLNKDIKVLKVDGGKGPIEPTEATIMDGTYSPLSRPLLMYVSKKAYETKPGVQAFVTAALDAAKMTETVKAAGFVPLPDSAYALGTKLIESGKTGTHLAGAKPGMSYSQLIDSVVKTDAAAAPAPAPTTGTKP